MKRVIVGAGLLGALCILASSAPVKFPRVLSRHLTPAASLAPVTPVMPERPEATFQGQHVVTFETITVAATSIGLTAATYQNMQGCAARLETAEVRYRYDGTAPTSTVGAVLEPLETVIISNIVDAQMIRFIRTGGTSGTLTVQCWSAS